MTDEGRSTIQTMLDAVVAQVTVVIGAAEERTMAEIRAVEERSQEFARKIETNLLTALHSNVRGQTARLNTAESTAYDMGIRLAAIEERLLNLETRRPPQ